MVRGQIRDNTFVYFRAVQSRQCSPYNRLTETARKRSTNEQESSRSMGVNTNEDHAKNPSVWITNLNDFLTHEVPPIYLDLIYV